MIENIPGSVTKSELADAYEISLKSFNTWLKIAGINYKGSHFLPPKVVERITDEFGVPMKWRTIN
jgi:hypothetical protein